MKLKTAAAAALLAIGAAGSAFADAPTYPNAGTQNPTTYTFTANGGDVMAYFMGSSASYNETLGLLIDGVDSGITGLQNHSTAEGASLDFGTIAAGKTLTFYIDVATTGDVFYSDKGLNGDGVNHVYSTSFGGSGAVPAGTYVGFEDLKGGGDLNYHDETFVFTNVGATPVTPAVPEPANLALLVSGLGLVGFMARRRRG